MNLKHLAVLVGSIVVFVISVLLFSQVSRDADALINELASLYSLGAVIGCGLAAVWLLGEFAGQD